MQIVLKEGYSATAPDLSALVTKLRRAHADVILHTGYNPDITLFWRQAKEQGLKWSALIGHGAGYGQFDKLHEAFGKDAEYIYNVDPVAAQLLDPKTLAPGLGELTAEMVKRYKAEAKADVVPPHVSMGFNQTWIFLTDVLPRAIKKYGGIDPESLRKAALDTDIPVGGTIQGYGVKFFPPGTEMAGQNERSSPVVMQYIGRTTPRSCGPPRSRPRTRCCRSRRARRTRSSRAPVDDGRVTPSPRAGEGAGRPCAMLTVSGLTKQFGGFTAVNRVGFELNEGEILGLIGPNGSGKSTTFNLIAGTLAPTAGSIRFRDREIAGHGASRVAHYGIGRTFQIPRPFRRLSVLENVALAAYYGQQDRPTRGQAFAQAKEALGLVGLPGGRSRPRRRPGRRGAEEARARASARHAAAAAARRRVARRPRPRRDGPGGRHAGRRARQARHHHHLGRAHHGRADARGGPVPRARPRRSDRRRASPATSRTTAR